MVGSGRQRGKRHALVRQFSLATASQACVYPLVKAAFGVGWQQERWRAHGTHLDACARLSLAPNHEELVVLTLACGSTADTGGKGGGGGQV